ncbi:MAG: MarR family winged helix-turn-helix transcriptional regulator [Acidobacteriota bacterium]
MKKETRAASRTGAPTRAYVAVLRAASTLQAGVSDLLRPHGLTHNQYNVLRILRGAGPEGATCGQIAERMINRDPDITRLLDRLEKAGLAARHRSARDRRTVVNRVTESGLRLLGELDEPVAALHREQFTTLGRAEVDRVIASLTAIAGE